MSLIPSWRSESRGGARSTRGKRPPARKPASRSAKATKAQGQAEGEAPLDDQGEAGEDGRAARVRAAPPRPDRARAARAGALPRRRPLRRLRRRTTRRGAADRASSGSWAPAPTWCRCCSPESARRWSCARSCATRAPSTAAPCCSSPASCSRSRPRPPVSAPTSPSASDYFEPDYFTAHGGAIGEVLYWASATLFQRIGAHIIALLMVISGVAAAQRQADRRADALRRRRDPARRRRDRRARPHRDRRPRRPDRGAGREHPSEYETYAIADDEALTEAEWEDDAERMTLEEAERATEESAATGRRGRRRLRLRRRRRGRARKGSSSRSSIPRTRSRSRATPTRCPRSRSRTRTPQIEVLRTPMGARRTENGITESEERDYRLPPAKLLKHGPANDRGPDKADMDRTSKALLEALGHFGVEAKLLGIVSGPHVSRFELQLAPGTKVGKVAAAQGRPRLRARLDRHPHPRSDPGQARGRRRGPERESQDGPPRRHLQGPARRTRARSPPGSARTSPASRSGPTWRRCRTS